MSIVVNAGLQRPGSTSLVQCLITASPLVRLVYPDNAAFSEMSVGTNLRYDWLGEKTTLIVNVTRVEDLQAAVRCASAEVGVRLTVMGGGHSFEASSSCRSLHGCLLLHMDHFHAMTFDPVKSVATVQAGTRLGRLYGLVASLKGRGQTYLFGGGTCPTVGVTGHVLCGGYGYLGRLLGFASDQVAAFEVVTAPHGVVVKASKSENARLFLALRGGCSTAFGVIATVSLRITVLPSTPLTVMSLPRVSFTDPRLFAVLAWWQAYAAGSSPREFTSTATFSSSGVDIKAVYVGSLAKAGEESGVLSAIVQGMQGIVSLQGVLEASTEGSFLDAVLYWSSMQSVDDLLAVKSLDSIARRQESTISRRKAKSNLPLSPLSASDIRYIRGLFTNGTIQQMEWKAYHRVSSKGGAEAGAYTDARSPLWRGHLFEVHWGASRATNKSEPEAERRARDSSIVSAVNGAAGRMNLAAKSARAYVGYIDLDLDDAAESYFGAENAVRLREARLEYDPSGLLSGPVDQYLYGAGGAEKAEEAEEAGLAA